MRLAPSRKVAEDRALALLAAWMMTPLAALAGAVGLWCLAARLKWAGEFVVAGGIFSHWLTWLMLAAGLLLFASLLSRYGKGGEVMP
jgi:hypothetical protein